MTLTNHITRLASCPHETCFKIWGLVSEVNTQTSSKTLSSKHLRKRWVFQNYVAKRMLKDWHFPRTDPWFHCFTSEVSILFFCGELFHKINFDFDSDQSSKLLICSSRSATSPSKFWMVWIPAPKSFRFHSFLHEKKMRMLAASHLKDIWVLIW